MAVIALEREIRRLVQEKCPELLPRLPEWMNCYKDLGLLLESLRSEYCRSEALDDARDVFDMDDEPEQPEPAPAPALHNATDVICIDDDPEPPQPAAAPALCRISPSSSSLAGALQVLRPSQIRFSQDTIRATFRDGRAILDTLCQLLHGELKVRNMPRMQVTFYRDALYSANNRRLCLYLLCEHLGLLAEVKVQLLSELPKGFTKKFTSLCEGDWVRVRSDGRICGRTLEQTTFGREELLS